MYLWQSGRERLFFDIPVRSKGILVGISRGVRATDQVCHCQEVSAEVTEQIKVHRKIDKIKAKGRRIIGAWAGARVKCYSVGKLGIGKFH